MTHATDKTKQHTTPMRWCIFVDILGFSQVWEIEQGQALRSLRELMRAIYRIGTLVCNDKGDRLFAHHMGDGFAIVSDFREASFERPLSIAAALMRHVASTGMFAAAAVAEGDFSDITGCYPEEVTKNCDNGNVVALGDGLMTISTVMGTAFIRAYRLNSNAPPGPFVVVPAELENRIPHGYRSCPVGGETTNGLLSIDWMRAESQTVAWLQKEARLRAPEVEELIQAIKSYCAEYSHVREKWSGNLQSLLSVDLKEG